MTDTQTMYRTPKMQLSPDVYVTDAFRAEINAWMRDFFGYIEEPFVYHDANLTHTHPTEARKKVTAKRRSKTQIAPDTTSFAALLNGLEDSFGTMQVPTIRGSWLPRKDVNAIKKIGIYVPDWDLSIDKTNQRISDVSALPSIASAYFMPSSLDGEDKVYMRFIFALREAKLPENVEATKGVPYMFGACFNLQKKDEKMNGGMMWAWCYVVVRSDGSVVIPHEMRQFSATIRHVRKQGKREGAQRSGSVNYKTWCVPTFAKHDEREDQEGYRDFLRASFCKLINWWQSRGDQWSVGVRKDGHRVTFSIDKRHTSAYFADREMVVNVDGKPRKIVHYVREHERVNGSVVREHVRGLRHFNWKGYECSVIAPGLKGRVLTELPIEPVELVGKVPDGYLDRLEVASRTARLEDAQ